VRERMEGERRRPPGTAAELAVVARAEDGECDHRRNGGTSTQIIIDYILAKTLRG